MPVYDYRCSECECEFTMLMPMSRSSDPMSCPSCAHNAQRLISAPHLSTMRAEVRSAHQINERSAHEPKMMTGGHRCGAECSHRNHGKAGPSDKLQQPALKQVSAAKRPWMLGH